MRLFGKTFEQKSTFRESVLNPHPKSTPRRARGRRGENRVGLLREHTLSFSVCTRRIAARDIP
jgi:hypothetical protein